MAKVLVIDNYDSFTYNLVQYLAELDAAVTVWRNDRFALEDVAALRPELIVISPGPGRPERAGLAMEVIKRYAGKIPIFGVCLGHQSIGAVYGAKIVRAGRIMHGKISEVRHNGRGIFGGLPSPFPATRYHSLLLERESLPPQTGGHGRDGRRRDHGCPGKGRSRGRSAVPSRVYPHPGGKVSASKRSQREAGLSLIRRRPF